MSKGHDGKRIKKQQRGGMISPAIGIAVPSIKIGRERVKASADSPLISSVCSEPTPLPPAKQAVPPPPPPPPPPATIYPVPSTIIAQNVSELQIGNRNKETPPPPADVGGVLNDIRSRQVLN